MKQIALLPVTAVIACAGLATVLAIAPAQATPSLLGSTVTATYLHDTTTIGTSDITVQSPFPELSCPGGFSGGGICNALEEASSFDIESDTITFSENSGGAYDIYTFNGIDFSGLDFGDGSTLSGFTLETNLAGLIASDISFTGNSISYNASGLSFTDDYYIELDLTTTPAPEPGTLALLGVGLAALAAVRRKVPSLP